MNASDVLNRLSVFPGDTHIVVADKSNDKNVPCCVRLEGKAIVVDFVDKSIAALGQANLTPITMMELYWNIKDLNRPQTEVILSNYSGEQFDLEGIRTEDEVICLDIDGVA